jgi:hypothetical protein
MTSNKTDEELYDILYIHSEDYTHDAIEAAGEEFRRRKLDAPTPNIVAAVREKEESHLSWPLRILAFFVSSAIFFIPLLLAHRHFVEKGERRKASEWARWAIYGFVFYCVLGMLSRVLASTGY